MDIKKWIKGHPMWITCVLTQSLAIVGLVCGFAALFMSTFKDDNWLMRLLFFDLPLVVFVGWVWIKAIIPWTGKAIDWEHERYEKNCKKEN